MREDGIVSSGTHNPNLISSRRASIPERDMVLRPILSQRFSGEESEQVIVNFAFGGASSHCAYVPVTEMT